MNEAVNEKVSVVTIFNTEKGTVMPWKLRWRGRDYCVTRLGFHHTLRQGKTLLHIFSVTTHSLAFKLKLDTDTLHWTLEEVYDPSTS
ncbi:hypothetical protein HY214_00200 [Candidatus Roizmanbacteria bacterium]|nr:hypothetical protein [Candidatus Roizmanbacteria bacterium]